MLSTFRLILLALLSVVLLQPTVLQAQVADKDQAELQRCTLTMENVTRFFNAMSGLVTYSQAHPEAASSFQPPEGDTNSLDQIAGRISSVPAATAILQKNGFTPREFVVVEMTIFQAGLAASLLPAGADPAKSATQAGINPANVVFMLKHRDEIDAMRSKAMPGS